jgi:dihydrodiol dehydrogenase / D-xylose 1-dehydrogenase (NADP)
MWTRCFPAMKKLRQIISSGEIGPIIFVQGDFGYSMTNIPTNDRHWMPSSGGITLDIGMYIAQFGNLAFPEGRVKQVHAVGNKMNGVDYSVMASVMYERGGDEIVDQDGMMQFVLTGAANTEERIVMQGTKGRVIIDGPFHIPQRLRVVHDLGRQESNETVYDFPLPGDPFGSWNNPGSIGFVYQINEVGNALREGKTQCDCFTWSDSLEVSRIIDEVLAQVRNGK